MAPFRDKRDKRSRTCTPYRTDSWRSTRFERDVLPDYEETFGRKQASDKLNTAAMTKIMDIDVKSNLARAFFPPPLQLSGRYSSSSALLNPNAPGFQPPVHMSVGPASWTNPRVYDSGKDQQLFEGFTKQEEEEFHREFFDSDSHGSSEQARLRQHTEYELFQGPAFGREQTPPYLLDYKPLTAEPAAPTSSDPSNDPIIGMAQAKARAVSKLVDDSISAKSEGTPQGAIALIEAQPRPDPTPTPAATFPRFMELPPELRLRVYELVLRFDEPIRPHKCVHGHQGIGIPKLSGPTTWVFHDENKHRAGGGHNEIHKTLAITKTCKEVREESLPVFYSANVFMNGYDTLQYFQSLEARRRLDLVRKVQLRVNFRKKNNSATVMQEIYDGLRKIKEAPVGDDFPFLSVSWDANMFLTMLMLAKNFNNDKKTITLTVPAPDWFKDVCGRLHWFPEVAEKMGLNMKLVPSGRLYGCESEQIVCEWVHAIQNEEQGVVKVTVEEANAVMKKALEAIPTLSKVQDIKRIFYRLDCEGIMTWHEEN